MKRVPIKKNSTVRKSVDISKASQKLIIQAGAKDFATRFEKVMRELSNG